MLKRLSIVLCTALLAVGTAFSENIQILTPIAPEYPVSPEVEALLQVAVGELGVTEDSAGQTKYGIWYGDAKAEWCAEFLCWSVAQAEERLGITLLNEKFPLYGAANIGREWFLREGRYIARTGFVTDWGSQWYTGKQSQMEKNSYVPQPGDWVFFSYTPSGDTTHAALVEACFEDSSGQIVIQVVEGNNPDKVQRTQYRLEDWRIQGYGTVHDLADIVLRGGAVSRKVARLQARLAVIGLLRPDDETGVYDYPTQEAVRAFQAMNGITQSGIANQQTQLALADFSRKWIMEHTEFWTVDGAF